MAKKTGIAAAAIVAAALLLYPLNSRIHKFESPDVPYTKRNLSPEREVHLKELQVSDDVSSTDVLCRNQSALDLKDALGKLSAQSGTDGFRTVLSAVLTEHPHMKKLIYTRAGNPPSPVSAGDIPQDVASSASPEMAKAEQAGAAGQPYQSGSLSSPSGPYFVIAVPAPNGEGSLTALVHQRILGQIREHQMKNLRVVPYPADGHWAIESVDSDTLKDVQVNHPEDNEGTSHYHKNQVVVKFRTPPSEEQLKQIQSELGAGPAHKLGYTYVFESSKMEARQMMDYFKKWNVDYAEPHFLYITNDKIPPGTPATFGTDAYPAVQPNDILFSRYQWNLPIIETLRGWDIAKGSKDVIVGVVDTGADLNHPDLKDHLAPGMNVVSQGRTDPQDDVGHGTHVAGIISALVNNGEGVAGMTWFNPILPVKVLDSSGSGSTYAVAQGVIWAADHGAKVINMSLGNYADAQFLHDAVKYAFDKDVVLVAASGNDNTSKPGFPAAYPEVFAVAATDAKKNKASFSNYGDYIDVAAPGVSIPSTYPNNQYAALSGTSMASPHVAALAALIRSANPLLKNTEVYEIMRQSAADVGPEGKDPYFGYGLIDVVKALQMADQSKRSLSFLPGFLERELERIAAQFGGGSGG